MMLQEESGNILFGYGTFQGFQPSKVLVLGRKSERQAVNNHWVGTKVMASCPSALTFTTPEKVAVKRFAQWQSRLPSTVEYCILILQDQRGVGSAAGRKSNPGGGTGTDDELRLGITTETRRNNRMLTSHFHSNP